VLGRRLGEREGAPVGGVVGCPRHVVRSSYISASEACGEIILHAGLYAGQRPIDFRLFQSHCSSSSKDPTQVWEGVVEGAAVGSREGPRVALLCPQGGDWWMRVTAHKRLLSFAVVDFQLSYATPSNLVCILSGPSTRESLGLGLGLTWVRRRVVRLGRLMLTLSGLSVVE
jgi:hypothetical protein